MSPGEHPHGAGLQARDMSALIDSPRQPRDDNEARLSQAARQPLGESQSCGGSVAGSHDRDRRLAQGLRCAPKSENGGRGVDLPQRRGIVRLAERDEAHPEFSGGDQLFFDLFDRSDADRALRAPRRASSGSAFSAAPTLPQLVTSARKVRGPTFSERTSRIQSKRCWSVRRSSGLFATLCLLPDFRLGAIEKADDVGAVLEPDQRGERGEDQSRAALANGGHGDRRSNRRS